MKNSAEPTQKDLIIFALIWSAVFIVIALYPLKSSEDIRLWALELALFFPLISFVPKVFVTVYKLWVFLGSFVGKINTFIILNFLFYIIITPLGIVMRLLNKDLLHKKINKDQESYWNEHEKSGSMKQQF